MKLKLASLLQTTAGEWTNSFILSQTSPPGDSAGGALSAATALKLRDEPRGIKLKYQVLIYPSVQGLTVDLPSHHVNEWHVHHMLSQKTISEVTAMYIGKFSFSCNRHHARAESFKQPESLQWGMITVSCLSLNRSWHQAVCRRYSWKSHVCRTVAGVRPLGAPQAVTPRIHPWELQTVPLWHPQTGRKKPRHFSKSYVHFEGSLCVSFDGPLFEGLTSCLCVNLPAGPSKRRGFALRTTLEERWGEGGALPWQTWLSRNDRLLLRDVRASRSGCCCGCHRQVCGAYALILTILQLRNEEDSKELKNSKRNGEISVHIKLLWPFLSLEYRDFLFSQEKGTCRHYPVTNTKAYCK